MASYTGDDLTESIADAARALAADDHGWTPAGSRAGQLLDPATRARLWDTCRDAAILDPLIARGVALRTAYVWGEGVTITGTCDPGCPQDLPGVVAAFLAANTATWSGSQAREELERALATTGNAYYALPTSPATGHVRVRAIPAREITRIITDPEDAATPWYYLREWTQEHPVTGETTRRRACYPATSHRPPARPRRINDTEVAWDTPIAHVAVNRYDPRDRHGTPDLLPALPWARGYAAFLGDWAQLTRALAKIAYVATTRTTPATLTARTTFTQSTDTAGQILTTPEGATFTALPKTGATIDSGSGRPLAAMVAAALSVPVTMLLADPGVTGARATAETLDRPMALAVAMRRSIHAAHIRDVCRYVIEAAVRAPRGPLTGTITRDPATGDATTSITGTTAWDIDVDWPDLTTDPIGTVTQAVTQAADAGLLAPLTAARLLAVALGVDDVDRALGELTTPDGHYADPRLTAADAAATAALRLLDHGHDPATPVTAEP